MKAHLRLQKLAFQLQESGNYSFAKEVAEFAVNFWPAGKGMFVGANPKAIELAKRFKSLEERKGEVPADTLRHFCTFCAALSLDGSSSRREYALEMMRTVCKYANTAFTRTIMVLVAKSVKSEGGSWKEAKDKPAYKWLLEEKQVNLQGVIASRFPAEKILEKEYNLFLEITFPVGDFLPGDVVSFVGDNLTGYLLRATTETSNKAYKAGRNKHKFYLEIESGTEEAKKLCALADKHT